MSGPAKAALAKFEAEFARKFNATSIERGEIKPYEVISTGSVLLDAATGVGGYIEGRLHEIWGTESAGKTTLAIIGMAEAQKKHPNKMVAIVSMEQTWDAAWAQSLGLDLARVWHIQPDTSEEVADQMKELVGSGLCSMVVLDSIGAMIPEAEVEKKAEKADMGTQAKIVTRMVKILAVKARQTGTAVIFINQVRANLSYGADTTTGGGFALKHATTLKFKIKRVSGAKPLMDKIEGEDRPVGYEIAVTLERNKVAPPYLTAVMTLFNQPSQYAPGPGLDRAQEATQLGVRIGEITRSGAWYTIGKTGEQVQGLEKVTHYLREHPELIDFIRETALAAVADKIIQHPEDETIEDEGDE